MIRSARVLAGAFALPVVAAFLACAGKADPAPDVSSEPLGAAATTQPAPAAEPSAAAEPDRAAESTPEVAAPAGRPSVTPREATNPKPSTRKPAPGPHVVDAPSAPEPAPPATGRAFIAAGTSIAASVDEELSTERTREGDRFHARLTDDVLGTNGEVLLPAGAVINGRVSTSHASTGPNDLAALDVEVESIVADGRTLPLVADVVELQIDAQARDSNTRSAAKVGIGAAAGAVVGRILGSDKGDAAKGAAVGAAAGAAVAAATRSGNAVVKPGARMVVKLSSPLVVGR